MCVCARARVCACVRARVCTCVRVRQADRQTAELVGLLSKRVQGIHKKTVPFFKSLSLRQPAEMGRVGMGGGGGRGL